MATYQAISTNLFTGEDKAFVCQILDASGNPQDITGWSLSWMVKRRKTDADADAIIVKTTASGIALTTPSIGICTITGDDDDLAALDGGGLHHHELRRTDTGYNTVLFFGPVIPGLSVHEV